MVVSGSVSLDIFDSWDLAKRPPGHSATAWLVLLGWGGLLCKKPECGNHRMLTLLTPLALRPRVPIFRIVLLCRAVRAAGRAQRLPYTVGLTPYCNVTRDFA